MDPIAFASNTAVLRQDEWRLKSVCSAVKDIFFCTLTKSGRFDFSDNAVYVSSIIHVLLGLEKWRIHDIGLAIFGKKDGKFESFAFAKDVSKSEGQLDFVAGDIALCRVPLDQLKRRTVFGRLKLHVGKGKIKKKPCSTLIKMAYVDI